MQKRKQIPQKPIIKNQNENNKNSVQDYLWPEIETKSTHLHFFLTNHKMSVGQSKQLSHLRVEVVDSRT